MLTWHVRGEGLRTQCFVLMGTLSKKCKYIYIYNFYFLLSGKEDPDEASEGVFLKLRGEKARREDPGSTLCAPLWAPGRTGQHLPWSPAQGPPPLERLKPGKIPRCLVLPVLVIIEALCWLPPRICDKTLNLKQPLHLSSWSDGESWWKLTGPEGWGEHGEWPWWGACLALGLPKGRQGWWRSWGKHAERLWGSPPSPCFVYPARQGRSLFLFHLGFEFMVCCEGDTSIFRGLE